MGVDNLSSQTLLYNKSYLPHEFKTLELDIIVHFIIIIGYGIWRKFIK
jgi:hypothetical protein